MPAGDDDERRPLLGARPPAGAAAATSHDAAATTAATTPIAPTTTFVRNLGTVEAFAIIIGIVVGSGVFTSPGAVDAGAPSPGVALCVWAAGGALAWAGAATLAELGAALPGEGGVQEYLRRAFGDAAGFLAAWTWIAAVMPATLAILAIVFVETGYAAAMAGAGGDTGLGGGGAGGRGEGTVALLTALVDGGGQQQPVWRRALSIGVLVAVGLANSGGTRTSTRLNGVFVAAKFIAVAAVAAAGAAVVWLQMADPDRDDVGGRDWFTRPWFGFRDTIEPGGGRTDWAGMSLWAMLGRLSTALYGALWAYSGWDKAVYITAELSDPGRQLPLAIHTAIPTVMLCFLAANAAYYVLLPWDMVSTTDSAAVTAIARLLGRPAGIAAAVLICLVVAGSLLGNSFVAGRMTVAAANKGWLPSVLGELGGPGRQSGSGNGGDASDAPVNALLLSTALASLYVSMGSFRSLLTFNGLGEYAFFLLAVVAALVLRVREPDLARPYRAPAAAPVAFALASGFVVVRGAAQAPELALVLVGIWAVGAAVFAVRRRADGSDSDRAGGGAANASVGAEH
ncbi:hypothetical protein HK405_006702 [Cladochytrium tenue]|nr:hypothetical protein HK405_006702 [Cladochytrium tenue]